MSGHSLLDRIRVMAGAILVLEFGPSLAPADIPSRDALRHDLIITRWGWYDPVGERYGGLWRLDPETLEYRRLRPFLATADSDRAIPHIFAGGDGFLTAHGDILTYRTWPAHYDFDAYSWRMIRRLPTASDPAEAGWVVQGPTLTPEEALPLGLAPGTYGVGRCVLHILAGCGETGPRWCEPSPFPVTGAPTTFGDDGVLLRREPPPEERVTESLAELGSFDWSWVRVPACLSLDLQHHRLWRCQPHGALSYTVNEGVIGPPDRSFELDLPPFDRDDVWANRLVYLPAQDRLLGTATATGERYLFSLDPATGEGALLDAWTEGEVEGAPDAMAVLGAPPERHEQLLPIVGGGPGAQGTDWTTELWLFNPSAEAVEVELRRVTRSDQARQVTLPPHGSMGVADALAWVGGGPGGDGTAHEALVVTAPSNWGEQLVVTSRISTPDPASGGRYGHGVPAVPGRVGYSNHTQYTSMTPEVYNLCTPGLDAARVDLDLREPGRYRYNLGVVNDLQHPLRLRLLWAYDGYREIDLDPVRPASTQVEVVIQAHGVEVLSLEGLFPIDVRERWAPRVAVLADQPAAVWLSMVDNLTGDATFIPFSSFHYANDNDEDRLVLPVVAHAPGLNGSGWQTDLYGYGGPSIGDAIGAVYHPTSPCSGVVFPEGIEQYLLGEVGIPLSVWAATLRGLGVYLWDDEDAAQGFRTVLTDVVRRFEPCSGEEESKGALEIAIMPWFSGFSRTYTTRPDGGTYGAMLPLYPPGGWPTQHFAGVVVGPHQRVNVGLFNGNGEATVTHRLLLYAEDGTLAATRELDLEPYALRQQPLETMLGLAPGVLPDGLYGLSVIPFGDPDRGVEGRSWAYVSLVDNFTNDPTNWW